MSRLSEELTNANAQRLSARAIARAAQERGYTLNHDTAARYLRGDHGVPDEQTLVALAEILGVPLRRLREAAALPSEATAPYVPPAEASRLTRRQRRAVDEIIRAMLDPRARRTADVLPMAKRAEPADGHAEPDEQAAKAARHGTPEPPVPD